MKLSIIIPAFNEERTIEAIISRVQSIEMGAIEKEILVVDDGSYDRTAEVVQKFSGVRLISHAVNLGKGGALSTGFMAATGDILLIQDADLEYNPEDYPHMIRPILEKRCDVVLGSRFLLYRPVLFGKRRSPYLTHYLGNMIIVTLTNLLYGRKFTDYEGCYKAFHRNVLPCFPLRARGFEFDNELLCKLMRKSARIEEIPIHYAPRTYTEGKKITWRHGLLILWTILKWRFLPV